LKRNNNKIVVVENKDDVVENKDDVEKHELQNTNH
jgi:hypothetical protein